MTELPFGMGTVTPYFAGILTAVGAYFTIKLINSTRRIAGTLLGLASLAFSITVLAGPQNVTRWLGLG